MKNVLYRTTHPSLSHNAPSAEEAHRVRDVTRREDKLPSAVRLRDEKERKASEKLRRLSFKEWQGLKDFTEVVIPAANAEVGRQEREYRAVTDRAQDAGVRRVAPDTSTSCAADVRGARGVAYNGALCFMGIAEGE
mgnify:FL=1